MKEYNLEGQKMTSKARAHEHIAHRLEMPESFGRNLDGLWDFLSHIRTNTIINFTDTDAVVENLGQYGEDLIKTFTDAAAGNKKIVLDIE
jgi:ribonuclease inhibitor